MEQEIRVAVFGATGYTGAELLRYLKNHPYVKLLSLTSQSHPGKRLREVFPHFSGSYLGGLFLEAEPSEDFDVAFLCLPHEVSLELVPKLLQKGKRVIDLSGAYRLKNPSLYPEYYHFEHPYPQHLQEAVYGLSEVYREKIKEARLVANPGCYPTAVLLAVYPLLKEGIEFDLLIVDALSGVSGAGRKTSQKFHHPEMEANAFAYSVDKHRHTPEMEEKVEELSGRKVSVRFTPQVLPTSRGMMAKVYLRVERANYTELYRDVYVGEDFIVVCDEPPFIKQALGSNLCLLYPYYDERTQILEVISVIDNLGKGASSQAVQNFNLMFGIRENTALDGIPFFP
ncbi:MAG: N-acetyl-gamma-glutamyl-phosphate reductase [Aquificota bacterium]|nr:MAG: N-acetyl-gamma-glutamyl-phosphate reductase [Aquificota bacterium]